MLEENTELLNVVDTGQVYLRDMATGARVLNKKDIIECLLTPEQETILKLCFGEKISEKV